MINKDMIGKTLSVFLDGGLKTTGVLVSVNRSEGFASIKGSEGLFRVNTDKVNMVLEWEDEIFMEETSEPLRGARYNKPETQKKFSADSLDALLAGPLDIIAGLAKGDEGPNQYGSFIPTDMLIGSDEPEDDNDVDLSISSFHLRNQSPLGPVVDGKRRDIKMKEPMVEEGKAGDSKE